MLFPPQGSFRPDLCPTLRSDPVAVVRVKVTGADTEWCNMGLEALIGATAVVMETVEAVETVVDTAEVDTLRLLLSSAARGAVE